MQDFFIGDLITSFAGNITFLLWRKMKLILKFPIRKVTIEMGSKGSDCLFCQTFKTNTKLVECILMKLAVFGKLVSGRLLEDYYKVY